MDAERLTRKRGAVNTLGSLGMNDRSGDAAEEGERYEAAFSVR